MTRRWDLMTIVQVIVGGLLLGAVYALFSSGLTLIWGMMNVINFAHGEFVMIGMYIAFLIGVPQFVAGIVAIVLTIGLHLLLTRTAVGSQLLAVAEDRQAAMLMGIRPDRMQAIAWGLSGAGAGIAGALIATFYYISPTVGESLALTAFVV